MANRQGAQRQAQGWVLAAWDKLDWLYKVGQPARCRLILGLVRREGGLAGVLAGFAGVLGGVEGLEHQHHDARGPGKGEHAGQGDDHGHHFPAFWHQIAVVADGGIGTAAEGDGLTKGVHQVQLKDEDGPEHDFAQVGHHE